MFRGRDGQCGVRESRFEVLQYAFALAVSQGCRGFEVQAELNAGVGGVDALYARSRCMREPFYEFIVRHDKPTWDARACWHYEVVHTSSVAYGLWTQPSSRFWLNISPKQITRGRARKPNLS